MATAGSACGILALRCGEDALARGESARHAFLISNSTTPLEAGELLWQSSAAQTGLGGQVLGGFLNCARKAVKKLAR